MAKHDLLATAAERALRWLLDVLKLPEDAAGSFVTGTTVAHITALAAARHAVLKQVGWDVEAKGLFGAPEITVITGAEAHPTLYKALGVVGFGRTRVVKVPVDDQGRMRVDAFPGISGPTIVCLQVGIARPRVHVPDLKADDRRTADPWKRIQGRMRVDAFPGISGPTIVCLQVGNVNTGSCDPVADLGPRARSAGAWVHIDGAF